MTARTLTAPLMALAAGTLLLAEPPPSAAQQRKALARSPTVASRGVTNTGRRAIRRSPRPEAAEPARPDQSDSVGHPSFYSPHAQPLALLPDGSRLYVTNTQADTVDVIDTASGEIVNRINVGVDPVGIAVRPDGREVWVANHISDSVSVIDSDASSSTYDQVVATIQSFDAETRSTRFDEPVGIAFANDSKAYVALSSENEIAVIDVASRQITNRLDITAQDPRSIAVAGDRLYVVPFESGNKTQLSGCINQDEIDGELCTFDAVLHVVQINNVNSLFYDADIVRHPRVPDRDLFIFDTATDELVDVVSTVGTLLYGVAADADGRVFVAQTEARNDANGRAGTRKEILDDLENRAFLNQIAMIDCTGDVCNAPELIELEPLPPAHPAPGMALATPFGIQLSADGATVFATAAGSDKLFAVDVASGQVVGRADVGSVPRGVALQSDSTGATRHAWVLNAVGNTVSQVSVSSPSSLSVERSIELEDPTHAQTKRGRIAFNNANQSSTGTFSCESCHPDGHTDQLLWVLGGPQCEVDGCTQIPVRSTMPIRGARDTAPYHWDGVPGDPFGGRNGQFPDSVVEPNCFDPHSCALNLIDGALGSTMCDQTNCPDNEEGKPGLLSAHERDDMAAFLLTVPHVPGRERPYDDKLTALAREGFDDFFVNVGRGTCGTPDCHAMPFWNGTNIPGSGMEAPSFRGLPDRWLILPQGRANVIDIVELSAAVRSNDIPFSHEEGFDELSMWGVTFGSETLPAANRFGGFGPLPTWQMFLEGSMGTSGAYGRQVTLNVASASGADRAGTEHLLAALENAADDFQVILQGEGVRRDGTAVAVSWRGGSYRDRNGSGAHSRTELLDAAASGDLVLTLTGRAGPHVDYDSPQPELWAVRDPQISDRHDFPRLPRENPMQLKGRHIRPGAVILIDGDRVRGEVSCGSGGRLPDCVNNDIEVRVDSVPEEPGMHLVQVQNTGGLQSNDFIFFVE